MSETYYNVFLALAGINNFKNPYYQFVVYLNLSIMIVVYCPIVYTIYLSIKYKNIIYIVNSVSEIKDILLVSFLYVKPKIKIYILDFISTNFTLDAKKKINYAYIAFTVGSFTVAFILTILNFTNYITLLNTEYIDIHPNNINATNNVTVELKSTRVFFNLFYTLMIDVFVIFHFILIFNYHANNVSSYIELLKGPDYHLHVIAQQLSGIHYEHNESISVYNGLFSITISCGIVAVISFFTNVFTDYTLNSIISYVHALATIIIVISFHIILDKINGFIDDLKQFSSNDDRMQRFLIRKKENYKINIDTKSADVQSILMKHILLDIENAQIIDWQRFNSILNKNLASFSLFGFDWDNGAILTKIISLIVAFIIGLDLFN